MTTSGIPDDGADAERQHAQEPAEGPDPDAADDAEPDVPRVHPQDPAEGRTATLLAPSYRRSASFMACGILQVQWRGGQRFGGLTGA